jgi:hypothetical protein
VLRGRDAEGAAWRQELRGERAVDEAVAAVWARTHLRDLEDSYVAAGGDPALAQRIIELSCRWQVLCRFTAFVAIDRDQVVNRVGSPHRVIQPVDIPSGWQPAALDREVGRAEAATMLPLVAQLASPPPPPGSPPPTILSQATPTGAPSRMSAGRARPAAPLGAVARAFGRLAHGLRAGWAADAAAGRSPIDLSAYRDRFERAFERARAELTAAARATTITAELTRIIEDLESVGAPRDVIDRLRAIAGDLGDAARRLGHTDLDAALVAAESEIRQLVPGGEGERRDSFWR